jgi:AraC-type DNA-binding domain-containing proteins
MKQYTDQFTAFNRKSVSDFILYNCGDQQCPPGYSYGPKSREYHFIHFVLEGEGELHIQDQSYIIKRNQAFICPAKKVVTYKASKVNPWKYCWISFLGIQSDHYVQLLLQKCKTPFVIENIDGSLYYKYIHDIFSYKSNTVGSFLKINGILFKVMGNLLDDIENENVDGLESSIVFQARNYMYLHYHDGIRINELSSKIGVHPNYLSTAFKKTYGISPKFFLQKLQVDKAEELLLTTDYPINIIANSVGFSDSLIFSKFFKKEKGVSPTHYREIGRK